MTVCRPFFRTANCPLLGFQNKCGLKLRTLMCGRRLRHCQPRLNNQTMGFCSASRFPLVLLRTVPFPLSEFLVSSVLLLSLCWRGSARPPVLSLPLSPPSPPSPPSQSKEPESHVLLVSPETRTLIPPTPSCPSSSIPCPSPCPHLSPPPSPRDEDPHRNQPPSPHPPPQ